MIKALGNRKRLAESFPVRAFRRGTAEVLHCKALGEGTKFLLADEITTMLDLITQSQIWGFLLKEVKERQIGLIAVSHNRQLLNQICTRQVELDKQR